MSRASKLILLGCLVSCLLRATTPLAAQEPPPRPNLGRIDVTVDGDRELSCSALSPNGKILALGMGAKKRNPFADPLDTLRERETIRLWDVSEGKVKAVLDGGEALLPRVNSLAFSPDGKTLASVAASGRVKLWDVSAGKLLADLSDEKGTATSLAYSPDGKSLATAEFGVVRLWDVGARKVTAELKDQKFNNWAVSYSPDGKFIASGGSDGAIYVWEVATGKVIRVMKNPVGGVQSLSFNRDGETLASAARDHTVRLWDVKTGKNRLTLSLPGPQSQWALPESLAFSPDGTALAAGCRLGGVVLWDLGTGSVFAVFAHPDVHSVGFSADGGTLVVGLPRAVRLWGVAGRRQNNLPLDAESHAVAFSPNGTVFAFGDGAKVVLRKAGGRKPAAVMKGHTAQVNGLAFSPDGKALASASADGSIRLWDAETGAALATLEGHTKGVTSVAFSPDGKQLVSGGLDGTVRLWDAVTRKQTAKLGTSVVHAVVFSPDGMTVASGQEDGAVCLYEATTGKVVSRILAHRTAVRSLAISPDGKALAAGGETWRGRGRKGDSNVKVWELATGKELQNPGDGNRGVGCVIFSPDGKFLIWGRGSDLVVWDRGAGKVIAELEGHGGRITSSAFSPDGRLVASASSDRTVKMWGLRLQDQDGK